MTRSPWLLGALALLAVGPACPSDIAWQNLGPGGGGWIQAIAGDPHDADTLYVGCDVGGFYISHDAGKTWTIQNEGLTDYFVECLAIHPKDSRIILLGTEGGIFKSADQGRTWQEKRQGFPEPSRYSFAAPIGALCFDPTRSEVLYAGIGRPRFGKDGAGAIYRSEDCGENWQLVTPTGALPEKVIINDLEVASDGSFVLAASDAGLYRSADGGAIWQKVTGGLPDQPIREVAIAPGNPRVVYCTVRTTAHDSQPWNGGVWRSGDRGLTWSRRSEGLSTLVGKADESSYMTSNYKEIVVDPRDADTVYVGDQAWVSAGVYKTTDGGQSWQKVSRHVDPGKNMDYGWITQWGPAVECLALSAAQPDRVVFGTGGQVFLTDNAGKTWEQRYCRQFPDGRIQGNGLEVTCLSACLPDPAIAGRVFFGYMDIGLLISEDRGATFRPSNKGMTGGGNCFAVVADPSDSRKLWAGTGQWGWNEGYICRSADGGATWTLVGQESSGLPRGQVRCLLVDPSSPPGRRRLYATCNGFGLYASDDDGDRWRCLSGGLPEAAKLPCKLLMDPANAKHLRVALGEHPDQGSGVYESRDAGQSWRKVGAESIFWDLKDFVADPQHFDTVYVCQRERFDAAEKKMYLGGLFRSDDGGATWRRRHDGHFASGMAVSPRDSRVLYLGTTDHPYHDRSRALGLLVSRDGGETWQAENEGLTSWQISCVSVDPLDPSRLYVGTGGNSAFVGIDSRVQ